ncbi:XRE family transcriptional regulator [Azotobacter salinestris]|uniref:XRE family transcriptional regulator n=1 Tax=Azotobacter salinestris TaxID=69964 RepID=UPI001FCB8A86|nr:XRE family transcriptional regulator [Azotobacter salinestris]
MSNAKLSRRFHLASEVGDQSFDRVLHFSTIDKYAYILGNKEPYLQAHKLAYTFARMNLSQRIKAARKHAGLTQRQLAEAVNVEQPLISQLETGKTLKSAHIAQMAKVCGVSAIWLASGEGEMLPSDAGNDANVESGSLVPAADNHKEVAAAKVLEMLQRHGKGLSAAVRKQIVDAVADSLAESEPTSSPQSNVIIADFLPPTPAGDAIRIVHYDVRTALGGGQLVPDYPEIMPDLLVSKQHLQELGVIYKDPCHLKMLTGYGQSMAPTIQHLDPMIVDVSIREFEGDGIYSFVWQGHFYTKRLQVADAEHFEMISDNPNHKDRMIRIDDIYIQARVLLVWNAKKL